MMTKSSRPGGETEAAQSNSADSLKLQSSLSDVADTQNVEADLRAYFAVVFGVGGMIGYPASGALFDLLGGSRLFLISAALELVAAGLLTRLQAEPESVELNPI